MNKAGWVDVWHLALAVVSRQPPFVQIMCATGVVFIAVMAVEGLRTSLVAIWRAHRSAPAPAPARSEPVALAAPAAIADAPASRAFSARSVPRAAATSARKRKPLTVAARLFRSPRPTIRRHPMLDFPSAGELPHFSADTVLQHEGV